MGAACQQPSAKHKPALPFKIDFERRELTIEFDSGVDQAHWVVALDDAKPEGRPRSRFASSMSCSTTAGLSSGIVVLLGSKLSVSAFEPIDLQPRLSSFDLNLNAGLQNVLAFHRDE
jgi:hypothetical protein